MTIKHRLEKLAQQAAQSDLYSCHLLSREEQTEQILELFQELRDRGCSEEELQRIVAEVRGQA